MQVGFLFNHDQVHQVAHNLPIALALAPFDRAVRFCSPAALRHSLARRCWSRNLQWRFLRRRDSSRRDAMDDYLAYFLDLRLRVRRRQDALAIVDRCIRLIARADGASAAEAAALQCEVEDLRAELEARFGPRSPVRLN